MTERTVIDKALLQKWVKDGKTPETIREELFQSGNDQTSINEYLIEFKRIRNSKKQFTGFACMAVGALMGFISLVLSLTNPIPGMLNLFMFGFTSLAILIVFMGLYLLFE